jgi:tetratricopeptide (TPR) repeat protein
MDATVGRLGDGHAPATLDDLAVGLRARRASAGSPSFSEIARRVSVARSGRGVHASERSPGRITVYDCFRTGRRRVDTALVLDIVRALGADEAEVDRWRAWCVGLLVANAPGVVLSYRDAPAPVEPFIGREEQLAALISSTGPVLITGMPGSGKTQLAARLLHEWKSAGRIDGVVTVDLRESDMSAARATAGTLLDSVSRTLSIDPDEDALDRGAQQVAEALTRLNLALLVDDVGAVDQVLPLLERVVATPLVLVSRVVLDPPEPLHTIELGPWRDDEVMALLRHVAGDRRVDAEADVAADLVALSGGLPLATSLNAARVAAKPGWTLAEHRDALRARLGTLRLDDSVSESIALSVKMLGGKARRALRLLATLPCDEVHVDFLADVIDRDADATARVLATLVGAHCVDVSREGRVGMHALIRTYAASRSWEDDPQGDRDDALDRLGDAMLARAWSAAEAIRPGNAASFPTPPPPPEPMERPPAESWLAAETGTLDAIAAALVRRRPAYTVELAHALGWYLDRQGLLTLALDLHERAKDAATNLGDEASLAVAENAIGQTMLRLGRDGALTHMKRAGDLAARIGLPRLEIAVTNARAVAAAQAGDLRTCLALFEEGLERAKAEGIDEFVGAFLDNIAIVMRRTGDLPGSLARHREAYEIAFARGDILRAAIAMSNLSDDQLAVGDAAGAVASAERAVALTRSSGGETHAYALTNLGMALTAQGRLDDAADHHRRALAMAREMVDPVLESSVLSNLGIARRASGAHEDAVGLFEQALALATARDIAFERGRALLELADTAAEQGERGRARDLAASALGAFTDDGSPERVRAQDLLAALDA